MTETSLPVLELDPLFKGTTIRPGDPEYDTARAVYNGSIDKQPALVLRPTGVADVADAVNYARDARLPLTVRCGGHAVAGTSANEAGVLLDLSSLKGTEVNPSRGTAIAQGGVLWGEYDRDTTLRGVATPGGRVTTTGVGGFTLGGGYGWLSPKYGLTCDNLVGADVVTADGRLVHVSETEHPDLLWALRGAGANFGVVVNYELRVHPIPPLLLAGMLVLPNDEHAHEAARAYRDALERAPEEVVAAIVTVLAPPADFVPPEVVGSPVLALVVAYVGPPEEALEALAPFRAIAEGGMDLVQPMPYAAFQAMLDGFAPKGWLNYHRGLHLQGLSDVTVDRFLEVGAEIHSPMTQGIVFRHGGAVARIPEDSAAASHRDAAYMAHPIACWATPEETDDEMGWVSRFTDAFAADRTGGVYLNFEPGTSPADVHAGFSPEKYARLAALKATWDPGNLFRSNHNIEPAG
ncbi:FAD-binding oxidoreductase [Nocardioides sp. CER19]|uniref:FAD-binding oxidoreductase n=1 Tax=Nocardioides sp. CER19 TaxID=3038538 RepID=UPI00244B049D|nr:FAD-binding oxidoreductase [Nocardioides sp. CER19]MDH2414095.1 FAD-binding oxidoreductase [Nocardioides sp. CER19]